MKINIVDKLKTLELTFLADPDVVAQIIYYLRIVVLVLSLGLAIVVVRLFIDSKLSTKVSSVLVESTGTLPPPVDEKSKVKKNYQKIVERNMFGSINPNNSSIKGTTAPKPITKLPLILIGVYINSSGGSYSIIENQKTKEQDVFMIGDKVFNEATVTAIKSDSIEINRSGEIETLLLDNDAQITKPPPGSGGIMNISETEFVVDREELNSQLSNLSLLLQQARAVPSYKNGEAIGLRIFAIRPDSLYAKIGLRNGDVLLNINGKQLGDLTEAIKVFEVMKSESSFTVLLERNRESKEFSYQVR